ncbi:hypothetical protein [Actinosynnema sp. NPDC023587]|uniref:hypothetical protein n=1 Tax=Actinosynnema sp. NPDC023587 TaxID=3154695 RepID=UPI0033C73AE0
MADLTRDPRVVAERARDGWTTWHPGDGTSYQAHVVRITGGPDHTDKILLLNVGRRTYPMQWSDTDYRHRENGRWTRTTARENGIPGWVWEAAEPLLHVLGATRVADAVPDTGPDAETDPAACLDSRDDRYVPACGQPRSEHCDLCRFCPGRHDDDCDHRDEDRAGLALLSTPPATRPPTWETQ